MHAAILKKKHVKIYWNSHLRQSREPYFMYSTSLDVMIQNDDNFTCR